MEWRMKIVGPRKPLEVEVDAPNKLAYIRVRKGKVARTFEHSPGVFLDVDAEGLLLGMELLLPVTFSGIKDASEEYLNQPKVGDRLELREAMSNVGRMLEAVGSA